MSRVTHKRIKTFCHTHLFFDDREKQGGSKQDNVEYTKFLLQDKSIRALWDFARAS